ncbi:hypothetical protein KUTeg_018602 [Tegillarca granosa]|uniref:G-protein coupled receptors family 1 profile domain-containing protein n=1 Tax=Tegillarca granosa TaxID=220873 RepID=A0ABQ9EIB6_TEGGR|nr:hypothetical protein KUTeg_018602 [Tegillarca granosa]
MNTTNLSNHTEVKTEFFVEDVIQSYIWKIVPLFMIITGIIGNILSILVLTRRQHIRKYTSSVYLTGLAVTDILVLCVGLLRQWVLHVFNWDFREYSEVACKLHIFLTYLAIDFSAWILVAVTIERVMLVLIPQQAKEKCTKHVAIVIMITILLFLFCLNSHLMFGMGDSSLDIVDNTTINKCYPQYQAYNYFYDYIWPWVDYTKFCILPFTILLCGNILIATKVINQKRRIQSKINPTKGEGSNRKYYFSSMNITLFILNSVFLICNTPISIYLIGYAHWSENSTPKESAILDLVWSVCNILMYLNNTVDFFLYCLSGTEFRREAKLLLCFELKFKHKNQPNNTFKRATINSIQSESMA